MNSIANGLLPEFDRLMSALNAHARIPKDKSANPTVAVTDSQSIRYGLFHSVKGIDGGKKIKGKKSHPAVDANGYPLTVCTSPGNVHDSKGSIGLTVEMACNHSTVRMIKADRIYEQFLHTARGIATVACTMFMLRFV